MPISFDPLRDRLPHVSRLKHQYIISGSTYAAIRASMDKPSKGGISISAVDAICSYLHCQPGDIMRWIPDDGQDGL